ncbi:MAG: DTW domain-containing protein [Gammaproteobacteria bacterium]|nr:DTW domain-containing protein [Gammaproteobacteria bacterium]
MARDICSICDRPKRVCLCPHVSKRVNLCEVGILQHPSEACLIKGTAKIAQLSLSNCSIWVGESLDKLPGLVDWLTDSKQVFLLYPEIEGQTEAFTALSAEAVQAAYCVEDIKVLVLDGTWRKTHKMMMLNKALRELNRIMIQPSSTSRYRIRRQKSPQSLSTVEAIYEVLSDIEGHRLAQAGSNPYDVLIESFEAMQAQQEAFRVRS